MPSCQFSDESVPSDTPHVPADATRTLPAALYVVATPIGNLEDMSGRAARILRAATWIAAEDTRSSRPLLQALGIGHSRCLALHAHNEARQSDRLLAMVRAGESVALITDAGTPGISDPGALLVAQAHAAGVSVIPIPGASAATTLLSAAGLPGGRFFFEGFLPARPRLRQERLQALAASAQPFMLFEAPHRITDLAGELLQTLQPVQEIVVGRELTKRFEQIVRMPMAALPDWLAADANHRRGEFALLIFAPPASTDAEPAPAVTPLGLKALQILGESLPPRQAARLAARISGDQADALYQAHLQQRG